MKEVSGTGIAIHFSTALWNGNVSGKKGGNKMGMRTIRTCVIAVMFLVFSGVLARAGETQIFELLIVGEPLLSVDDKDSMTKTKKDLDATMVSPINVQESSLVTKYRLSNYSNMANMLDSMSQRIIFLRACMALTLNSGDGGMCLFSPF